MLFKDCCDGYAEGTQEIEDCKTFADKYKENALIDPLKDIAPTLLSPEHLKQYIEQVGIIYPFDSNKLRTPTYKVPLYGDVYFWEEIDGKLIKNEIELKEGDTNTLKISPNSVTYVHISTIFRVPYYLAFRFNLTVSLAQKGLLLGTGPIVDPGYEGRIMIPIHNLTDNTYNLKAGCGLIKVEVTKLSNYTNIDHSEDNPYGYLFPENSKNWTAEKYFQDINENEPIRSFLPAAISEANETAKSAEKSANESEKASKLLRNVGLFAVFVAIVSLGSFLFTVLKTTTGIADKVENKTFENQRLINNLQEKLNKLDNDLKSDDKKSD